MKDQSSPHQRRAVRFSSPDFHLHQWKVFIGIQTGFLVLKFQINEHATNPEKKSTHGLSQFVWVVFATDVFSTGLAPEQQTDTHNIRDTTLVI